MNVSTAKQTLYFLLAFMSLWGCAGKSILVANFETDVIGQSPATTQKVGTVRIDGPVQNCTVEKIANIPGKWVKITRPNNPAIVDGLQGVASESKGDGKYVFTGTLYIPDQGGVATLQFEAHNQPTSIYESFLHIDFLENGKVRVNDNSENDFGSFPKNQPFIIQVTLTIEPTSATADIVLSGAGTSGTFTVSDLRPHIQALQFGNVRLWMGFPWVGSFYATNLVLKYEASNN